MLSNRATRPDIFFHFDSVVIVGASDDPNRIGGAPIELLRKYGFQGAIYGLNPKYTTVQGVPCFSSPEELPEGIDVAIISVSVEAVRGVLPVLAKKGLKGAVIFSAGFAESGAAGREQQDWLSAFARDYGIAIVGPNCVGLISFVGERSLTFANALRVLPVTPPGRVALLSQSGGIATNIWADALLNGTRFSHLITTGNEADLGFTEFLEYLAADASTEVVLGYIEGLADGAAFCRVAAKMQAAGKPLILIKVGSSPAGMDVVASHTGQLSSDDSGYNAAFDRYGVVRVRTLQDLNDHARVFSLGRLRQKITAATTSGGAGVYVADLCTELGLELSTLSADTERQLSQYIPSFGRLRNPVDLTAQVVNDNVILEKSLRILLEDDETGVLLLLLSGKGTAEQSAAVTKIFRDLQSSTDKTLVVSWLGVSDQVRQQAAEQGVIVYQDPERFLRPLRAYLECHARTSPPRPQLATVPTSGPRLNIESHLVAGDGSRKILPEAIALDLLTQHGVECPRRWTVTSAADLDAVARSAPYPCVMKISKPVLAHKSDVGGVRIGLQSQAELMQAWKAMAAELGATEVIVAEQVSGGAELIVGCLRDETFGMRLTIGSGGVWANYTNDAITLIPPFGEDDVRSGLERLLLWPRLSGKRGQEALAVDLLVSTIVGIAEFGLAHRTTLREFECNPIIVNADRAVAVDALGFA